MIAIHSFIPWQLLAAWSGRDFAIIKASSSKVAKRKSIERTSVSRPQHGYGWVLANEEEEDEEEEEEEDEEDEEDEKTRRR